MYHYTTYLKHVIKKPVSKRWYDKKIKEGFTLEYFIRNELTENYYYREFYLPWCESNSFSPLSDYTYRKYGEKIYNIHHHNYDESAIDYTDSSYLESIERKEVKRKSYINQNMILFYKNYFKRRYANNQ